MSDRKPSLILPVAVVLAVLLTGYAGAYYAMVFPALGSDFYAVGTSDPEAIEFRRGWCRRLFAPIPLAGSSSHPPQLLADALGLLGAVTMTAPRKPGFVLPVAVTLAVLLGLYVGAYFATMKPDTLSVVLDARVHISMRPVTVPTYPARWLHTFFAPIHWLDRRIRPHVWESTT